MKVLFDKPATGKWWQILTLHARVSKGQIGETQVFFADFSVFNLNKQHKEPIGAAQMTNVHSLCAA